MKNIRFLCNLVALILANAFLCAASDPNFRNIFYQTTHEAQNQELTDITGKVPDWLSGDFVRQGCASYGDIDGQESDYIGHMFDCLAMVARYSFKNGKVNYSNQMYDTKPFRIWKHYNYSITKSKVGWETVFSPINPTAFDKNKNIQWNNTLNQNPAVTFWKSKKEDPVLAVTEGFNSPAEIQTSGNLMVKGHYSFKNTQFPADFGKNLLINNPAHEQYEKDGTIWSSTMDILVPDPSKSNFDWTSRFRVYTINGKQRSLKGTFTLGKFDARTCRTPNKYMMPGYTHFIQTTEKHVILPQTSYLLDFCQMASNVGKVVPGFASYKYHPDRNVSIIIFERENMTNVHHVILPYAKFFTHDINAFETSTHIFLDTFAYDGAGIYTKYTFTKSMLNNAPWQTSFLRIAINKKTWAFEPSESGPLTKIDPYGAAEFPQINYEEHHQKNYSYVYFNHDALRSAPKTAKLDVYSKKVISWMPPVGHHPQEPIFVRKPGGCDEDDGILLVSGPVSNPKHTSFLAILDAKDLTQIAMVTNQNAAPLGLHNRFYGDKLEQCSKTSGTSIIKPSLWYASSIIIFVGILTRK